MSIYKESAERINALFPETNKAIELEEMIFIIEGYIEALEKQETRLQSQDNTPCHLLESLKKAKAQAIKDLEELKAAGNHHQ